MYCPRCGELSRDSDRFCNSCGLDLAVYREQAGLEPKTSRTADQEPADRYGTGGGYGAPSAYGSADRYGTGDRYGAGDRYGTVPHIPSYLGWAIVVLIFCFWPTGIAAVVYASQVDNRLAMGDIAGARASSRKARMWCWITFGIGIALYVIGMAMLIMLVTMTPLILS